MFSRIPTILMITIPLGLVPAIAWSDSCGDYPLSEAKLTFLQSQSLDIVVPEGQVPVIQRCDVDGNNVIDNNDLKIIREHRGEVPAHPDDPMDWDGDHVIHGRDVGGCASSCTANGCAVKDDVDEEDGLEAASALGAKGGVLVAAACYQTGNFTGSSTEDFVGIFEYTGPKTRGNDWSLEVVILTEDENGNVGYINYPYSGQVSSGAGDLKQHLSLQPAGVVDLNPGTVTITNPGVVSYRNGVPEVIFYFDNGAPARAFYGVDD